MGKLPSLMFKVGVNMVLQKVAGLFNAGLECVDGAYQPQSRR